MDDGKVPALGGEQKTKVTYRTSQLDGGVESVIEGVIYAMRVLLEENSQEEDCGFLLIDAWN